MSGNCYLNLQAQEPGWIWDHTLCWNTWAPLSMAKYSLSALSSLSSFNASLIASLYKLKTLIQQWLRRYILLPTPWLTQAQLIQRSDLHFPFIPRNRLWRHNPPRHKSQNLEYLWNDDFTNSQKKIRIHFDLSFLTAFHVPDLHIKHGWKAFNSE